MSQKFNYFGFKAVMQYALNSALWYVYLYLKSVFIVKKNIFSSNFSLEEYGGNLKIVKSETQRIFRNLNNCLNLENMH